MPGLTEEQRRLIAEGAIVPRRERIATAALQGLLGDNKTIREFIKVGDQEGMNEFDAAALVARHYADALMRELDKESAP